MKITKEKLIGIWKVLDKLSLEEHNLKFSYAIAKNKKLMLGEIECLQDAEKPAADFIQYESDRIQLCESLCEKNPSGEALSNNGKYIFSEENKVILNERMEVLVKQYDQAIVKNQEARKHFADILNEEIDIVFYPIKLSTFPETIAPRIIEILEELIEED